MYDGIHSETSSCLVLQCGIHYGARIASVSCVCRACAQDADACWREVENRDRTDLGLFDGIAVIDVCNVTPMVTQGARACSVATSAEPQHATFGL